MKKLIKILLITIMFCICLYTKTYATNNEYKYEIDSSGQAIITAYIGNETDITIPNEIDGYEVKSIADHAFHEERNDQTNGKNLEKVIISEGITKIGDFAFIGCENLESIQLPEGLIDLGDQTFIGCKNLKEINIPSSLERLDTYVFQETGIEEITIPETLEYIGNCTFRLCENLKKFIVYSESLEYAGNVFEYCSDDLILYGEPGSTTEDYANEYDIEFKDISTLSSQDEIENESETGDELKYQGYNVMGQIEIPKTNLKSVILEKVTKQSIEIAIAILYTTGGGLNQPGNTVLVGHNYRNGTLFSDNYKLSNGDIIKITDNSGTTIEYEIYDIFETSPEDTEFMTRDTQGRREISLSTTTDDARGRLIILASEKGNVPKDIIEEGKQEEEKDTTVANKILPQTGSKGIAVLVILGVIIIILLFKRIKLFNKIKK